MDTRHFVWDDRRELILAKLHDGHGNFYIFNCPSKTAPDSTAVLDEGELVSAKLKGDKFRRNDGITDQLWRVYNMIEAIEYDGDEQDFATLLQVKKETAPAPGDETTRKKPEPPQPAKEEPKTAEPKKKPLPSLSTDKNPPTFKGRPVDYSENRPFVTVYVPCVKCNNDIPMKHYISRNNEGYLTRTQSYIPADKRVTRHHKGGKGYICPECNGSVKTPPPPAAPPPKEITGDNVTLADVVKATREAGAEVRFHLEPEPPQKPLYLSKVTPAVLLEELAEQALDNEGVSDKFFRGAAWAIATALKGKV